LLCDNVK
jgi:hypothetical protein